VHAAARALVKRFRVRNRVETPPNGSTCVRVDGPRGATTDAHAWRTALVALIVGAVLIGLAPIFVRLADVGYTAAAFWRAALAAPILYLLWWPRRDPQGGTGRLPWLWLAGAFFAADLAAWHQSIRFTSVANSTLLANLAPVFVTGLSVWLFKEKITRGFAFGLLLALTGALLLTADSLALGRSTALGDLLGVLTALFYAGYQLSVVRLRRVTSVAEIMWWSTLATAVLLLPVVLIAGETLWPQSAHGWLVLLGLAMLPQVAGQGLIAHAMAHLPASFSSVSLLVQPVAATVFAWLLLAEALSALQALGGAVVLGGILVCGRAETMINRS
jgi:drug/metabolite transporter (DMT)-like permease